MRVAVTGSIATDHLMTFPGRFADVAGRREARQGLAVVPRRRPRRPPRRRRRQHRVRHGLLGLRPAARRRGRPRLRRLPRPGSTGTASTPRRVHVSEVAHTARFVCTTDADQNQIASFYPGAMSEARESSSARSPSGRRARPRRRRPERPRGDAPAHRRVPVPRRSRSPPTRRSSWRAWTATRSATLIDGAAYLFTNEYEAALTEQKTGWTADEVLDRVGTRVTTLGAQGRAGRAHGRADRQIAVPARGPQGRPDRRRRRVPRRLPRRAGLGPRPRALRAGRRHCSPRTSSRPSARRSTRSGSSAFLDRLAEAYGEDAAAEVGRTCGARVPEVAPPGLRRDAAEPVASSPTDAVADARGRRARGPGDLVAVGADLEPGTLLAAYRHGLFPMPVDRRGRARLVVAGPAGRPAAGRPAGQPVAARSRCVATRSRVDTALRRRGRRVRRRRGRDGAWISDDIRDAYVRLHGLGWAHSVETWRDGELVGGLYGVSRRRAVRRRVDVPPGHRRVEGRAGRAGRPAARRRRPAAAARRAVGAPTTCARSASSRSRARATCSWSPRPSPHRRRRSPPSEPDAFAARHGDLGFAFAAARLVKAGPRSPASAAADGSAKGVRSGGRGRSCCPRRPPRRRGTRGRASRTRPGRRWPPPGRRRAASTTAPAGVARGLAGQVDDRQRAQPPACVDRRLGGRRSQPGSTPASARSRATTPGSTREEPVDVVRGRCRGRARPARCRATARPSRPARARARGCSRVHDDPELTANPARSSSVTQRLAVDVQAGERDEVGEPVVGVADDLDVGDGRGDPLPDPVDQRAEPGVLGRRLALHRLQRGGGGDDGRDGRRSRAPGRPRARRRARGSATAHRCAPPGRRPRAGRPTCGRSRSATDQPAGTAAAAHATAPRRPAGGRPRRRTRRRPRRPAARVPTSWFADCTQASVVGSRSASVSEPATSTRPRRSTSAVRTLAPCSSRCQSAAASTLECSTADTTRAGRSPRRVAARTAPATARWLACVPEAVNETSSGRAPTAAATTARDWSSRARARRPGECRRDGVGPALVVGGEQGLAGRRMERRAGRRVEVRHARSLGRPCRCSERCAALACARRRDTRARSSDARPGPPGADRPRPEPDPGRRHTLSPTRTDGPHRRSARSHRARYALLAGLVAARPPRRAAPRTCPDWAGRAASPTRPSAASGSGRRCGSRPSSSAD